MSDIEAFLGPDSAKESQIDAFLGDGPQASAMARGAAGVMGGMADTLSASLQGASPIVRSLDGRQQQRRLGAVVEMDYGPAIDGTRDEYGAPIKVDPSRHVILRDPDTGGLGVYERGPNTAQDTLAAIGRLLSFGAIAPTSSSIAIARTPNTAAAAVRDFEAANIDPALAATSAGRTAPLAAQTIRNAPFVGDFAVGGGVAQRLGQAETQAGRVAGMYGEATDAAQGGRALQEGVGSFRKKGGKFSTQSTTLYDDVERLIPQGDPVAMSRTQTALSDLTRKFNSETLSDVTAKPALAKLQQGVSEGQLTYAELKKLRSWVGEQMEARTPLFPGVAEKDWQRVYAAMSDDMRAAAEAAGPEASKAFARADRFYSAGAKRAAEKLQTIVDADSPEKAFNQIMLAARAKPGSADSQKVWAAMRSMPAEEWREVSAAVIAEIGKGRDGFSVTQFANNYKALSEPAKTALFSGKGMGESREALEALVRSAERLSRMEQYQNRSQSMSQGITAASGAAMFADPLTTTLSGIGAAATGRLLMSPAVARWMARASEARRPEAMNARVAELETLIQTQRGLSSELSALRDGLRDLLRGSPRPMAAPARDEETDN